MANFRRHFRHGPYQEADIKWMVIYESIFDMCMWLESQLRELLCAKICINDFIFVIGNPLSPLAPIQGQTVDHRQQIRSALLTNLPFVAPRNASTATLYHSVLAQSTVSSNDWNRANMSQWWLQFANHIVDFLHNQAQCTMHIFRHHQHGMLRAQTHLTRSMRTSAAE